MAMNSLSSKTYEGDLWVVIKPAEDVPGVWVSHCLTLDVMSQGPSPHEAFKYLMSAVFLTVADDLLHGRDPAVRGKKTPKADWEEQAHIVRQGKRVRLRDEDNQKPAKGAALATNIGLLLTVNVEKSTRRSSARVLQSEDGPMPVAVVEQAPPAWMISAPSARTVHR